MRKLLFLLMSLIAVSCSTEKRPATAEELASAVAKTCYEALYNGVPVLFLDGRIHADEMPESYRQQLMAAYQQHVKQVNSRHLGVKSIEVSGAERDTTLQLMQVFLMLTYGDNSKEEIVVPMVEHEGKWLMK